MPVVGRPLEATVNNIEGPASALPLRDRPVVDSGATRHLVPHKDIRFPLAHYRHASGFIRGAGNHELAIKGLGWYNPFRGATASVVGLGPAIFSVPQDSQEHHYWSIFGPHGYVACSKPPLVQGRIVRTGTLSQNTYFLDPKPQALEAIIPTAKGTVAHQQGSPESPSTEPQNDDDAEPTLHQSKLRRRRPAWQIEADRTDCSHAAVAVNHDREPVAVDPDCESIVLAAHHSESTFHYWHSVFAHLGRRLLNAMISHKAVQGLPHTTFATPEYTCVGCALGNLRAAPVARKSINRPAADQLPTPQHGPLVWCSLDYFEVSRRIRSLHGNRYCLGIRCHGTQMIWVVFFKKKTQFLTKALPWFLDQVANDGVAVIQNIKSDPDPSYWTPAARQLLKDYSPTLRIVPTPPGRPDYNGMAESTVSLLAGRTRATMAAAPWMPNFMWESATEFTANRACISATARRVDRVPLNRYMPGLIIDVSLLKPWGTPCYYATTPQERSTDEMPRLAHRSRFGYITGEYDFGRAGYKVYDPKRKKEYHRVDVRLDATDAGRKPTPIQLVRAMKKRLATPPIPLSGDIDTPLPSDTFIPDADLRPPIDELPNLTDPAYPTTPPTDASWLPPPLPLPPRPLPFGGPTQDKRAEASEPRGKKKTPLAVSKVAGSRRAKKRHKPVRIGMPRRRRHRRPITAEVLSTMSDSDIMESLDELEELQRILRQKRRQAKGKNSSDAQLIDDMMEQVYLSAVQLVDALPPTPSTMDEAMAGPNVREWTAAKVKEKIGLESQGTWADAPDHKGRAVKSRWAFRVSREPDGSIKFRARLVAKGFSERKGIDYFETFAPTVSTKALFALLHIAASRDWEIRSIDVGNAYLEAELDTEIYMDLPPEGDEPPRRVRLLKSIYGLKQAGELWNRLLNKHLSEMGFTRCFSDSCVYVRIRDGVRTYVATYVDDILTFSSSSAELLEFEAELGKRVKKLSLKGDAIGFLGMEFQRNRAAKTITITQRQFIGDAINDEGLTEATTKPTPGSSIVDLNKAERGTREPMRAVVGRIRYTVDHVHPEALFIASQLSSAAANPGDAHWKAGAYCMRYLKGAADVGITLGGPAELQPEIFVDASYIEDGDARSQLGYCVRLNGVAGMIHSRSIRDTATSLSASEAELRALKEAVQEAIWLRVFLTELGFPSTDPTPVHEDNQAVVNLIATLKSCPRTRHLNKIRHFLTQQAQRGRIKVKKIAGERNVADILTKALEKTRFLMLRAMLLGEPLRAGTT